ncbi:MAG: NHL repeat-containing protein, partial [Acidobacteriota bacterium]
NATFTAAPPVTRSIDVTPLTEPVATTSPIVTTTLTFTTPGTLSNTAILTLGVPNLDYKSATGSSCTAGTTYATGQTCTVAFTFTPTHPGLRAGGITLTDAAGNILSSTLLSGTGTGPQVTFTPGTQSVLTTTIPVPFGMAVDGNGNLFAADAGNNTIKEFFAATNYTTSITLPTPPGAFTYIYHIAIDGNGNLFTANEVSGPGGSVVEVFAAGGYSRVATLAPGNPLIDGPEGLALDPAGNVYVTRVQTQVGSANRILEITAASNYTTVNPIAVSFVFPVALNFDANGNMFVAAAGVNAIQELLAVNGTIPANPTIRSLPTNFTVPGGYNQPNDVALDGVGNLFVTDGNNVAYKVIASTGYTRAVLLSSGLNNPQGITTDANGNVFIADENNNRILRIDVSHAP